MTVEPFISRVYAFLIFPCASVVSYALPPTIVRSYAYQMFISSVSSPIRSYEYQTYNEAVVCHALCIPIERSSTAIVCLANDWCLTYG